MFAKTNQPIKETVQIKCSRVEIHRKIYWLPALNFEDQQLTSFSGLIIFQALFARLQLKRRLQRLFCTPARCADLRLWGDGVAAHRAFAARLPGIAGYSLRSGKPAGAPDPGTYPAAGCLDAEPSSRQHRCHRVPSNCAGSARCLVLERLACLGLKRITVDFDGSVLSTGRFAEGTAVGFNRKKKGQRSYYHLFCTLAQTGQILDAVASPGQCA